MKFKEGDKVVVSKSAGWKPGERGTISHRYPRGDEEAWYVQFDDGHVSTAFYANYLELFIEKPLWETG